MIFGVFFTNTSKTASQFSMNLGIGEFGGANLPLVRSGYRAIKRAEIGFRLHLPKRNVPNFMRHFARGDSVIAFHISLFVKKAIILEKFG